ncbi:Uncharacterised protein [Mycobacteroides abscessus subsp. abscessus]|nr:Uncharacterised protein [Mycobacteroides abscessus subsp. abscessus]
MERPALFTRMSTPPCFSLTVSTSLSMASRSDKSHAMASASPPSAMMRAATSASRSSRRATTMTLAPSLPNW